MHEAGVIALEEYVPKHLAREGLSDAVGALLWQCYKNQVAVDFPSPKTGDRWQLTSQGWVGHLPLTEALSLALRPKVAIANIFRMLEYAYGLKSFHFLEGVTEYDTLEDVYERLAHILARRVLDRVRKGLYREYVARAERLPFVRGRMDVQRVICQPWAVQVPCHYHLHTPDVDENRILAWTLRTLLRSGLRRPDVRASVRTALRYLQGSVTLRPYAAAACVGRRYSRLNEDYHPMHALCRFFLEHIGPSLESGTRAMLPFLVNMAQLFESFVAAWLRVHLPASLRFRPQDRYDFSNGTYFRIDLVLYEMRVDGTLGPARLVLDTKYKVPRRPAADDVAQVIAYAVAKHCREAVLVYPSPLLEPLDEVIGNIRVRSLTFALEGALEEAGRMFLERLLGERATFSRAAIHEST